MNPSVLIVDDSLTVRMDLADAFDAAGFRAIPCSNAAQARRAFREDAVDAVVLDVLLPDGDGVDLLRELRSDSGRPSIPVIMLSGEADIQDRLRGLTTGADDYVGKPYDKGYVIAKVRELVHGRGVANASGRPVLVIDDSASVRAEVSRALEEAGYATLAAQSGEEGLRLAATCRPTAIIVDGMMPGIDGAGVIRRIRLDTALRGVPCVLLTGATDVGSELAALEAGADAFVHKGDDTSVLLAKLGAVLRSAPEASAATGAEPAAPKRILAVDDSRTYREAVSAALRDEGYEVIQASSGEEALELLKVQLVDCVLLDLVMPGMGGKETCRRLKGVSVTREIPVIVLTAIEDRTAMVEGLSMGADDFIPKSAEFEVLKARVRAQLRRRQFEDEARRFRERLLRSELQAAEARAARELAETRAVLVDQLRAKNVELEAAYEELKTTQSQLVQSAKMASLGSLVAGVAHEINNPLAFVLSHLGTVQRSLSRVETDVRGALRGTAEAEWGRAVDRLDEMALGLERIRDLVVKLRTFSRLDEGEIKRVSVRESIEALLTILGHRIKDGIRVETRFGEPDDLECFPSLLNQAVMNLLTNALDAIGQSGTLRIESGASGGEHHIVVADDGPGIRNDHRDRVFEPFFTTKPIGEGTGLGLSIAYSIVRKHGGTLELRSGPSGGTEATIRVPADGIRKGEAW